MITMKRTIVIALAVAVVAVFAGCSNFLTPSITRGPDDDPPPAGYGTVRLDLGLQAVARSTFKPELPDLTDPSGNTLLELYHFIFKQGGTPVEVQPNVLSREEVADQTWPLPLGDYTVTVQAGSIGLVSDPTQVYATSGAIPFTLAAGGVILVGGNPVPAVHVTLTPVTAGDGVGELIFAFDYPEGATVTDITLSPLPGTAGSAMVEPAALETLSGGVYTTHNNFGPDYFYMIPSGANPTIPAGFYTLAVRLRDSQGRSAGNSVVVHIYAGMTTYVGTPGEGYALTAVAPDFTFVASDFAGILVDGVEIEWGFTRPGDPNRTDLDEPLVLYKSNPAEADPVAARQKTIAVSSGDIATVKWYLDGVDVSGVANTSLDDSSYTLDAAALALGSHTLTITVETPTGEGLPELPNKSWSQHIPLTVEAVRPLVVGPEGDLKTILEGFTTPGDYVVDLTGNVVLTSVEDIPSIIYLHTPGVNITLRGTNPLGENFAITQTGADLLFFVANGAGLTLRDITLQGGHVNSDSGGGGVFVYGGVLTMEAGAVIRGNTAGWGAGVLVAEGTFLMKDGVIAGNTATSGAHEYGGGVEIRAGSFFVKTGGIIYGNEDSVPEADRNTTLMFGHAVMVSDSASARPHRDSTVGLGDNLSVTLDEDAVITALTGDWQYPHSAEAFLFQVNHAANAAAVRALLNVDDISALYDEEVSEPDTWDDFIELLGDVDVRWAGVAATVLDSRPPGGYADEDDLGDAVFEAVILVAANAALVPDDVLDVLEEYYDEDAWEDLEELLGEQGLAAMATAILNNRPEEGYANMDAFNIALNAAILAAQGEPLDPDDFVSTLNGLAVGTYIYTLTGDVTLASVILLDTPDVDLTLNGDGHTITQDASIRPFSISNGATLTLQNIKLLGGAGKTGWGVYVGTGSTFVMQDDVEIRGFTAPYGAGVYVNQATFHMEGGVIAGNTGTSYSTGGGGVYMTGANASFVKIGGIIYGKYKADTTPEDTANANTIYLGDNWGPAVMVTPNTGAMPYRDTTVGEDDNLSITLNSSGNTATLDGNWAYH